MYYQIAKQIVESIIKSEKYSKEIEQELAEALGFKLLVFEGPDWTECDWLVGGPDVLHMKQTMDEFKAIYWLMKEDWRSDAELAADADDYYAQEARQWAIDKGYVVL